MSLNKQINTINVKAGGRGGNTVHLDFWKIFVCDFSENDKILNLGRKHFAIKTRKNHKFGFLENVFCDSSEHVRDCSEAERIYKEPMLDVLRETYPNHRKYRVLEDNDPSFQCKKAKIAKAECKVEKFGIPGHTPQLNRCDY